MRLLFKQRLFSWLDSYDIYDENQETVFTVESQLAWGHMLKIYDHTDRELGVVKQKLWTFLPKFEIYHEDQYMGYIEKEFTFLKPVYHIDYLGWYIEGDWMEWDYTIYDQSGSVIATISKEIWNWTDTYVLDITHETDALYVLMLVLAIDAEKCSRNNG